MLLNLHIIICIFICIPIIIYVCTAMKHNLSFFSTPSHSLITLPGRSTLFRAPYAQSSHFQLPAFLPGVGASLVSYFLEFPEFSLLPDLDRVYRFNGPIL